MTVKAKEVLKDKFWVVEDKGERIGTLSVCDDRYMFSTTGETCFFDNKRQIENRFGFINFTTTLSEEEVTSSSSNDVYGYPASSTPYNSMYDVKRKLPLFTKSTKSKSLYCAGYYTICFDKGWVKSFCPKMITIERYESRGPFKTEIEMRQELSRVNAK